MTTGTSTGTSTDTAQAGQGDDTLSGNSFSDVWKRTGSDLDRFFGNLVDALGTTLKAGSAQVREFAREQRVSAETFLEELRQQVEVHQTETAGALDELLTQRITEMEAEMAALNADLETIKSVRDMLRKGKDKKPGEGGDTGSDTDDSSREDAH